MFLTRMPRFEDFLAIAAQSRAVLLAISWSEDIFVTITRKITWYSLILKRTGKQTADRQKHWTDRLICLTDTLHSIPAAGLYWRFHLPFAPTAVLYLGKRYLGDLCRELCPRLGKLTWQASSEGRGFEFPAWLEVLGYSIGNPDQRKVFQPFYAAVFEQSRPPSTYSASFSSVYHNQNTDDRLLLVRRKLPLTHWPLPEIHELLYRCREKS